MDDHERCKALVCRNLFNERSDLLRIDRYELVRTLGSGGMGVVYEVVDVSRRTRLALKTLKDRGATDLYRLKREFRSLAELAHPNLVTLHELRVAAEHAFFTMELVRGQDILSFIRGGAARGAQVDEERLRSALAQLGEGIHALHAAGKLHRDIKPSNVLVTETGRVVLLDFGLVQDVQERGSEIAYVAPEQRQGNACESSDWFSFGRIVQHALGKQCTEVRGQLASELSQLAAALLEPEPARRPGWLQISRLVRAGTRHLPRRPRAQTRFIGRSVELAALDRAFAWSRLQPLLMLVRGSPGSGKTALMREFVRSLPSKRDALVLSSRCYPREFVAYNALDGAIDELSRHLSTLPIAQQPQLGEDERRALVNTFPVLGRVPWNVTDTPDETLSPPVQRRRGFDALKKVLSALARERPLVVCIDDMQWSDVESGALLAALLCDRDAAPLLVLCADRTDRRRQNRAIAALYRASECAPKLATVLELLLERWTGSQHALPRIGA